MAEIHVAKPRRGGKWLWLVLLALVAFAATYYLLGRSERAPAAAAQMDTTNATAAGVIAPSADSAVPALSPSPTTDSATGAGASPDSPVATDTAPGRRPR